MTAEHRQTVRYRTDRPHRIHMGLSAIITPYAHPSPDVTGDGETPVYTSPVQYVDYETGEFWTRNTRYIPADSEEPSNG